MVPGMLCPWPVGVPRTAASPTAAVRTEGCPGPGPDARGDTVRPAGVEQGAAITVFAGGGQALRSGSTRGCAIAQGSRRGIAQARLARPGGLTANEIVRVVGLHHNVVRERRHGARAW
jgi:hypothetical protein